MQVTFIKWSLAKNGRTPVSINPARVEHVEFFTDATQSRWDGDEALPAGCKITMRNKAIFYVQGEYAAVVEALNTEEAAHGKKSK